MPGPSQKIALKCGVMPLLATNEAASVQIKPAESSIETQASFRTQKENSEKVGVHPDAVTAVKPRIKPT